MRTHKSISSVSAGGTTKSTVAVLMMSIFLIVLPVLFAALGVSAAPSASVCTPSDWSIVRLNWNPPLEGNNAPANSFPLSARRSAISGVTVEEAYTFLAETKIIFPLKIMELEDHLRPSTTTSSTKATAAPSGGTVGATPVPAGFSGTTSSTASVEALGLSWGWWWSEISSSERRENILPTVEGPDFALGLHIINVDNETELSYATESFVPTQNLPVASIVRDYLPWQIVPLTRGQADVPLQINETGLWRVRVQLLYLPDSRAYVNGTQLPGFISPLFRLVSKNTSIALVPPVYRNIVNDTLRTPLSSERADRGEMPISYLRFHSSNPQGMLANSTLCATLGKPLPPLIVEAIGIDLTPIRWLPVNTSIFVDVVERETGATIKDALYNHGPFRGQLFNGTALYVVDDVRLKRIVTGRVSLWIRLNSTGPNSSAVGAVWGQYITPETAASGVLGAVDSPLVQAAVVSHLALADQPPILPQFPRLTLHFITFRAPSAPTSLRFDTTQTFPRLWHQAGVSPLALSDGVLIPELRIQVMDSTGELSPSTSSLIASVRVVSCQGGYLESNGGRESAVVVDGMATFRELVLRSNPAVKTGPGELCVLRFELAGNRTLPLDSRPIRMLPPGRTEPMVDLALYSQTYQVPELQVFGERTNGNNNIDWKFSDFGIVPLNSRLLANPIMKPMLHFNLTDTADPTMLVTTTLSVTKLRLLTPPQQNSQPSSTYFFPVISGIQLDPPMSIGLPSLRTHAYRATLQTYFQPWSLGGSGGGSTGCCAIHLSIPVKIVGRTTSTRMRFAQNSPSFSNVLQSQRMVAEVGQPIPLVLIELLNADGTVDTTNNETRVTVTSGSSALVHTVSSSHAGQVHFTSIIFSSHDVGTARLTFTAGPQGGHPVGGDSLESGAIEIMNPDLSAMQPFPTETPETSTLVARDVLGKRVHEIVWEPYFEFSLPTLELRLENSGEQKVTPTRTRYLPALDVHMSAASPASVRTMPWLTRTVPLSFNNGEALFASSSLTSVVRYQMDPLLRPLLDIVFCLDPPIALVSCVTVRVVFGLEKQLPLMVVPSPLPVDIVAMKPYSLTLELRHPVRDSLIQTRTGWTLLKAAGGELGSSPSHNASFSVAPLVRGITPLGDEHEAHVSFENAHDALQDGITYLIFSNCPDSAIPKDALPIPNTLPPIDSVTAAFYVQPPPPLPSNYPVITLRTFLRFYRFDEARFLRNLAGHFQVDVSRFFVSRIAESATPDRQFTGTLVELQVVPPTSDSERHPTSQLKDMVLSMIPNCDTNRFDFYRSSLRSEDTLCDHFSLLDRVESARHCEAFGGRAERCPCFEPLFIDMGKQCQFDARMPAICSHLSRCKHPAVRAVCTEVTISIGFQVLLVGGSCLGVLLLGLGVIYLNHRRTRVAQGRPTLERRKHGTLIRSTKKVRHDEILLL